MEDKEREGMLRAARICVDMIAEGRAWTQEQGVAADALAAAAEEIRNAVMHECQCDYLTFGHNEFCPWRPLG